MGNIRINELFIYRWRYWIGYSTIAIAFLSLLLFAGLYVPGALSQSELTTSIKSASVTFSDPASLAVTNLPYALLQQASFQLLGVTSFSIKLPSLIIAFITGVGLILLLRRWFRPNIAVLATIIMVTTGQFLFIAQHGTAGSMHLLWATWLLLSAAMFTSDIQRKTVWRVLFFVIAGLSLYTPLSVYLLLAIGSAAILHPHIRHILKREPRAQLLSLSVVTAAIASPLIYLSVLNPSLPIDLLGMPDTMPGLIANAVTVFQQYFNFMAPSSGVFMTPILGLGSIVLIALGIYRLYITRHTARSYTITAWGILLVPVLLINPSYISITFIPFLLLLASGLDFLLRSWYRMFPRNPYARIAGLVPLVILVSGLVLTGVARYVYGYHYDPHTASSFSRDLTVLNHQVRPLTGTTTLLVVSKNEKPFYDVVAKYNSDITISTTVPTEQSFAATREAHRSLRGGVVEQIIATSQSNESDRFYIYK